MLMDYGYLTVVYVCVADYECIDSVMTNSHVYYMRKIGSSYECVQSTSTSGAMLQRTRDIGENICRIFVQFVLAHIY